MASSPSQARTPEEDLWARLGREARLLATRQAEIAAIGKAQRNRERELARWEEWLARLGDELAERERLLAVAVEERDAESEALERRAQELTECLAALECDEVELGERKRKLERREARLRSKEKKIAARVHELQQPEAEPEGTHAALERHVEHDTAARLQRNRDSSRGTEGMSSGLELARGRDGRWNHAAISRTVRACAGSFPHRGVEWEAFLRELGSYVDSNGFLPPRFDALVEEVFGELFDRTSLD